ncbi:hypothetical protein JCM21900_000884 [Sporobolomyces salmonicolor]
MEGELPTSGHSYFGVVSSAQEAHAILEASKLGLLPRVTRRLTDEERICFVRAGAVFVWEEEEAGIRRWTDHIKWSPSRVSGAFLTYSEIPSRGEETLIKQSFSSVDPSGTKMHLIAYTNKSTFTTGNLPSASRDPLIQGMLARRSNAGRDPRQQPAMHTASTRSGSPSSSGSSSGKRRQYRGSHPALPPIFPVVPNPTGPHSPRPSLPSLPIVEIDPQRAHSASLDDSGHRHRPRSSSGVEQRPSTSRPSPRPSSSYDTSPYGASSSSSHSIPSLPQHTATATASPSTSTFASSHLLPPAGGSSHSWSFPSDLPFRAHPQDHPPPMASFPRLPSIITASAPLLRSPLEAPTSTSPPTPAAPPTAPTASPFDPFPRQLPPIDAAFAAGLPSLGRDSPPRFSPMCGTFLDDNVVSDPLRASRAGAREARGSEDERQLRLLGRTL